MQPEPATPISSRIITAWRLYFLLAFGEGIFVLLRHFQAGSESASAVLWGLSASRVLIGGAYLALVLWLAWLIIRSWARPDWFQSACSRFSTRLVQPKVWGAGLLLSLAGLFLGIYLLLSIPETGEAFTRLILARLAPALAWLSALCAQTILLLLFLRAEIDSHKVKTSGWALVLLALAVAGLLAVWAWVVKYQFPTESKTLGWNELGAPLLETQVFLGWGIGMGVYLLISLAWPGGDRTGRQKTTLRWLDIGIALTLWLGTVLLWSATPTSANWFVTDPRPPNFAYYPDSDAADYDKVAQELMIGEGYEFAGLPYIRRPLHGLYLLALHGIAGQDYPTLINYQILILATLPLLIYLLASLLSNRLAGLFAAVFIALREANSIVLASRITTSNARTLLVDLPTALVVVLFVLVFVVGLRAKARKPVLFLVVGGLLGMLVLLRPEMVILVIPSVLILLAAFWKQSRWFLASLGMIVLGGALVLSPWMWRNWQATGRLVVGEDPSFRIYSILERYREQISPAPTPTPGEIPAIDLQSKLRIERSSMAGLMPASYSIMAPAIVVDDPAPPPAEPEQAPTSGNLMDLLGSLATFIRANAGQLGRQFLAHYMNSQMQVILVLPTEFRPARSAIGFIAHRQPDMLWAECCMVTGYVRDMPYWRKWSGQLTPAALFLFLINLTLIGAGVLRAWKKEKVIGLVPLIFCITHLLSNAVFRNSGGRYILPVDWAGVVYFSIGLAVFSQWAVNLFAGPRFQDRAAWVEMEAETQAAGPSRSVWRMPGFYLAAIGLLLLGCVMVASERLPSKRYTEQLKEAMLQAVMQSDRLSVDDRQWLASSIQDGATVEAGRGLYPRYIRPRDVEFAGKTLGVDLPYRRIEFELIGPANRSVVLPLDDQPDVFPQAADVLLITRPDGQVLAAGVIDPEGRLLNLLLRSPAQR